MRVFNYTGDVIEINGEEYDAIHEIALGGSRKRRTVVEGFEAWAERTDSILAIGYGIDEYVLTDLYHDQTPFLVVIPEALGSVVRLQHARARAQMEILHDLRDNLERGGASRLIMQALEDQIGDAEVRVAILERIVWKAGHRYETVG